MSAAKEEILVSREFLVTRLKEIAAQEDGLFVLTERQREFLERVAASAAATPEDVIAISKELLELFLAESR